ncbi:CU044_5270 family protein [Spirillospora sp. CA-294931]|uniref:CU044_5270 family protein n=1 Tax=Spirillospora sp. CA-294931 TaxID=3240042 RepID=UPI003D8A47F9
MTNDEITLFREARPDVAPYDDGARARARALLVDPPAAPRRMPRRRLVTAAALPAALAVGLTVLQVAGSDERTTPGPTSSPGTGPGRTFQPMPAPTAMKPVANALDLANNAAVRAAGQPGFRPRSDQWVYVKTIIADSSKGQGGRLFGPPDRRTTLEDWQRADGLGEAEFDGDGKLEVRMLTREQMLSVSPRDDYQYVLSLPDTANALYAHVTKAVADEAETGAPTDDADDRAFHFLRSYIDDYVLPPKLRAAMYGALALVPGVEYTSESNDILGRKAVTLYREANDVRDEIFVDPKTYEYLGDRSVAVRGYTTDSLDRGVEHIEKGTILGWGGRSVSGLVDKPGQRL